MPTRCANFHSSSLVPKNIIIVITLRGKPTAITLWLEVSPRTRSSIALSPHRARWSKMSSQWAERVECLLRYHFHVKAFRLMPFSGASQRSLLAILQQVLNSSHPLSEYHAVTAVNATYLSRALLSCSTCHFSALRLWRWAFRPAISLLLVESDTDNPCH